ncbi:hypothetical protein HPP92_008089 [Vanilla planifolia]|uniref:Integrator complex subunit 3 N-terminal domain-containing protein n=1 Tax=Vanilla planifolia TaxID=51239 RepID=A0A835V3G0_VANPL|nr:hypothetical protein HPP92_008089 [Vanilla planifolia]
MNTSTLLRVGDHDAENPIDSNLRLAFSSMKDHHKPPYPLEVPSPSEYSQLTRALVYGILTEPHLANTHLTYLHAIVTDGYSLFTSTLVSLSNESYPKLLETPRSQLLWVSSKLVQVEAVNVQELIIALLRQIKGGNFSDTNLWLCSEIITILSNNWAWLLDEPLVMTSALFVFLRLLSDHYRMSGSEALDKLKRIEVAFTIRVLSDCFPLCLCIGRDLIRLLQDLVNVPEFKDMWLKVLFDPGKFELSEFRDISQFYKRTTPSHYLLLRITPEMEAHLRFLLNRVKWGYEKRYQVWFSKKHLCSPGSETSIIDIVRFICYAHQPSNEIIHPNVTPRWAIISWLLKFCRKNYLVANVKLALFYDWLFFDENVDSIPNIEPAMLLMVNSIDQHVEVTNNLLEFLLVLVDNYDVKRKDIIAKGVSTSFSMLVRKKVVHSLESLSSCNFLSPVLREKLSSVILGAVKKSPMVCTNQVETSLES